MMAQWLPASLLRTAKKIVARILITSGLDSFRYKRDYKYMKVDGESLEDPAIVDGYKNEGGSDRVERLVDLIVSQASNPRTVLDIGCGTGRYLRRLHIVLPDATLEGVDISPEILEKYARPMAPAAGFYPLDIETDQRFYREHAGKYDLICMIGIIQVLARRKVKATLRKIHHMCADGGVVYIQFNVETGQKKSSCGYKRYSIDELSTILEECSFKVIKSGRTDILEDYAFLFAKKSPKLT